MEETPTMNLVELVRVMDQFAQLEYDFAIDVAKEYPDGSLELKIFSLDESEGVAFSAVIAEAGSFKGHRMIVLREVPVMGAPRLIVELVMCAVPRLIIGAILALFEN